LNNSSKHSEAEDDSENINDNEPNDTTKQQDSNADSSILKNEINSLNQEIKSLMKRIKTLEEGCFILLIELIINEFVIYLYFI